MTKQMNIGIIGLDTSHVAAFTKLLNQSDHEYHVSGGNVTVAYPGGSPDFELSSSRVEGFTQELKNDFGVFIVERPEDVAQRSDAILLESVDGRVHADLFRRIAPFGKPVFVDKPFAVSSTDAQEIMTLAEQYQIPLMSCSALRYAEGLKEKLSGANKENEVIGADTFGPMAIVPTQPGYFWYGIHSVEMLFAILGKGCTEVKAFAKEDHDVIVGQWSDDRIGTVRGNRKGNNQFGAVVHRENESQYVDVYAHPKPYYASLLEKVMVLFETGQSDVDPQETLQIIRFIEAANESKETGKAVALNVD